MPGSYLWHGAWSNSRHRNQSWSWSGGWNWDWNWNWSWNWNWNRDWNRCGGSGLGRREGVLRRHAGRCCGGDKSWDSVGWGDRLWLRRRNGQRVAGLVPGGGVERRLWGDAVHSWRLRKAYKSG